MSFYELELQNNSETTACYVLYFTCGKSKLFASVVWSSLLVSPNETGRITWSNEYEILLSSIEKTIMKPSQHISLKTCSAIDIKLNAENNPIMEHDHFTSDLLPNQALVTNKSGKAQNLGLGSGGKGMLYTLDNLSGTKVLFDLPPQAWLGIDPNYSVTSPAIGTLIRLNNNDFWQNEDAVDATSFAYNEPLDAYAGYCGYIATLLPGNHVEIVNLPF